MWTIQLNDDEYKVLVKWLSKEPYPSENNFPHIHSALNKLLNAKEITENNMSNQNYDMYKWHVIRNGLKVFVLECARIAREHGFWDNKENSDRLCMLIVGEVAEAHEELRSGHEPTETYYEETKIGKKPCGVPSEFADILIRVADHAAQMNIETLPDITVEKMQYNEKRPFKHGRQF